LERVDELEIRENGEYGFDGEKASPIYGGEFETQ
jgi:hypothetical protein